MSLQYISFCSGSSGNASYLLSDGVGLLIDAGISLRKLKQHFSTYGLSQAAPAALLLTHDHTDHAKGVGAISAHFHLPVYGTERVHKSIDANHHVAKKVPVDCRVTFSPGDTFTIGPFRVTTFHVPHDSAENVGYHIEAEGKHFVLLTDVGHFTDDMIPHVQAATHLVVEANYDPVMLSLSPYPLRLKNRILAPNGHTSNEETAQFLIAHLSPAHIRQLWLCHLSAINNRPQKALDTIMERLQEAGFNVQTPATPQPGALLVDTLPRHTPSLLTDLL